MAGSPRRDAMQEATGMCLACCPHGGLCTLPPGHDGQHQADVCRWDDADSIPRELGDRRLAESGSEGAFAVGLTDFLEGLILATDENT